MALTLGKNKRLKSKKKIQRLFDSGEKLYKFPIRAIVCTQDEINKTPFEIAVSVPKKLHKNASDRNLLKRRMREAFRRNQHQLNHPKKVDIMWIYTTKESLTFEKIQTAIQFLIAEINALSSDKTSEKSNTI